MTSSYSPHFVIYEHERMVRLFIDTVTDHTPLQVIHLCAFRFIGATSLRYSWSRSILSLKLRQYGHTRYHLLKF